MERVVPTTSWESIRINENAQVFGSFSGFIENKEASIKHGHRREAACPRAAFPAVSSRADLPYLLHVFCHINAH